MKKLLLFLLLLPVRFAALAQDQPTTQAVQAVIVRLFDGLSAVDEAAMRAELTPDFSLLEDGRVWNADSLVRAVLPMKTAGVKRVNTFKFIRTERRGDVAWISYYNTAELSRNGQQRSIRWLESAVLLRQKGAWKIQLLHSTALPPPQKP